MVGASATHAVAVAIRFMYTNFARPMQVLADPPREPRDGRGHR